MNETDETTWTCEWFARCTRQTTHGADHPVLGVVPICDTCATNLDIPLAYTLAPIN